LKGEDDVASDTRCNCEIPHTHISGGVYGLVSLQRWTASVDWSAVCGPGIRGGGGNDWNDVQFVPNVHDDVHDDVYDDDVDASA